MNPYTSPQQLASVWRRMADTAAETGETPLIALGIDSLHPDSGLGLLALSRIARRSLGPQNPVVVAGGEGELWLLGTLLWQRPAGGTDAPPDQVLYAGGDAATHAAALNTAVRPVDAAVLPPGMAWMLSPTATPGAERSDVELLPLALAEEDFVPQAIGPDAADWLAQLERWLGLLLALGLLIGAVLV